MVVLLVRAGNGPPDPEPVFTALGGGRSGEVLTTTDAELPSALSDDLLGSLATVIVLSGTETEAASVPPSACIVGLWHSEKYSQCTMVRSPCMSRPAKRRRKNTVPCPRSTGRAPGI